jgi:signal peptidase I
MLSVAGSSMRAWLITVYGPIPALSAFDWSGKSITKVRAVLTFARVIGKILDTASTPVVRVNGSSMEPTLSDGSWVLVNRRAFTAKRRPARFDIVRLENPDRPGHWIVKRIVGLPLEEVRLDGGALFIDGNSVEEAHLHQAGRLRVHEVTSPQEWRPRAGEYIVLGDNRTASTDSRKFGSVRLSVLRGKIVRRIA